MERTMMTPLVIQGDNDNLAGFYTAIAAAQQNGFIVTNFTSCWNATAAKVEHFCCGFTPATVSNPPPSHILPHQSVPFAG
jgi:hypothetical protein